VQIPSTAYATPNTAASLSRSILPVRPPPSTPLPGWRSP